MPRVGAALLVRLAPAGHQLVRHAAHRNDIASQLGEAAEAVEVLRRSVVEAAADAFQAGVAQDGVEPLLSSLLDSTLDVICVATLQGKPIYLNKAARRLLGISDSDAPPPGGLRDCMTEQAWNELCEVGVPAVARRAHPLNGAPVSVLVTIELIFTLR